jgi:hydroxyethylthiazole kinase-like uncharacterized protein yjeF
MTVDPPLQSPAEAIISLFGGVRPMARALSAATGVPVSASTVQGWGARGRIPAQRQADVLAAARTRGLELAPEDFFALAPAGRSVAAPEAGCELLDVTRMAAADRATVAAGVSGERLMEAAGSGTARIIMEHFARTNVVVLCGPGNNGGDGFVIARHLARAGWPVRVAALGPVARLTGDAALHARRWQGRGNPGRAVEALSPEIIQGAGLVVDALFGAGLARPLEGAARAVVEALAARDVPVVAVDLPSGVSGDSGDVVGGTSGVAVQAMLTVTFFRKKPGHLLFPGKSLCGELKVIQIGIEPTVLAALAPDTFENLPEMWAEFFPWPDANAHKYTRGQAVICGGAEMPGAARLAARAAMRIGAGLVTVAGPPEALGLYRVDVAALLTTPVTSRDDLGRFLEGPRCRALLAGPGLGVGRRTRELARVALARGIGVCLDADALTSFADWPDGLFTAIAENASAGGNVVLTPHGGEFSRLFRGLGAGGRLRAARDAARLSGGVVVLKGADTVIAAPDGRAAINGNAPPWLATAGSGDVLAGLITGLLAQQVAAFEAAAMAVWIHGAAAKKFGPGLIADDLPELVPGVLEGLRSSGTARKGAEIRHN